MMRQGIVYLDHNATTPVRPEAREAIVAALGLVGNASSVHAAGRMARRALEQARERVADLVGAEPDQVVFTSGGTEANNMALGMVSGAASSGSLAVSAIEHDSVLAAAPDAIRLPVDGTGRLKLDALAARLRDEPTASVALMHANNETGVVQPVAETVALCHAHQVPVLLDAVQTAARLGGDEALASADMITLSAHKLGGPQGIGALIIRGDPAPCPLLRGGGQERRWRAGTENLPGIVGFGVACACAGRESHVEQTRLAALRDALETQILRIDPDVLVLGAEAPRLANTSCLTMPGVPAETQIMALDLDGVAVSAGAACSSGRVQSSHVLRAMGVPPETAACAIRVSLGWTSSADDVERFVAAWAKLRARTTKRRAPDLPLSSVAVRRH